MEIALFAIVSSEPLYRLSWLINQQLGWNLTEAPQIALLHQERKEMQPFFVFSFVDEAARLRYSLIQNKGSKGALAATMRQIDFWLRIEGDGETDLQTMLANIKGITQIQLIQQFAQGDLKKEKNLFSPSLLDATND